MLSLRFHNLADAHSIKTQFHRLRRKLQKQRPKEKFSQAIQSLDEEAEETNIEGQLKLVSVPVSRPNIENTCQLSIKSENVIHEGTEDVSSIYSDDKAIGPAISADRIAEITDISSHVSIAQTQEIQPEIASLWLTSFSDNEVTEQLVSQRLPTIPEESTSMFNRSSISSNDHAELSSSKTLSSHSSTLSAPITTSSNAEMSNKPEPTNQDQRRPFTLNEMIELDIYCERRQNSMKRGVEWMNLFWGFESAQRLFLWKYGWQPEIERMEEFWRKKEKDRDFWQLWDFPCNLI
jgi:hypothetical protein